MYTADEIAECEHRVALHFEAAYDAALEAAAAELRVDRPLMADVEDDRCHLPARAYAFLASAHQGRAVHITATPAGGGAFATRVTARYSHLVAQLGEEAEDRDHFEGEAPALVRALELSLTHGSRVYEVSPLEGFEPVALVYGGEVYRRA